MDETKQTKKKQLFCLLASLLAWFGFLRLYSPGCPGTNSVNQVGLEPRDLPAS